MNSFNEQYKNKLEFSVTKCKINVHSYFNRFWFNRFYFRERDYKMPSCMCHWLTDAYAEFFVIAKIVRVLHKM